MLEITWREGTPGSARLLVEGGLRREAGAGRGEAGGGPSSDDRHAADTAEISAAGRRLWLERQVRNAVVGELKRLAGRPAADPDDAP